MFGRDQKSNPSRGMKRRALSFEPLEERVVLSSQGLVAEAPAPKTAAVSHPLAAELTIPDWVHSLSYLQFNLLLPDQVQYLTTQQVASIPDIYSFSRMSDAARGALSVAQVQSLRVSTVHLDFLTPQQITWLTVPQIQSLWMPDFQRLSATQTPYLTPAQIATIPDPGPFAAWTPEARAALTLPQIQSLDVGKVWIDKLTPQQVVWLSIPQIQSLRVADLSRLTAIQTPYLTPAQIAAIPDPGPFAAWSPEARAALTLPQIQALNVANVWIDKLTAQQVVWLSIPQIQALRVADLSRLTAIQTPFLTPAQLAAIPDPGPFAEWSASARAALTATQVQALNVGKVWLFLLTPQQVTWLSAAQIQTVRVADFVYLGPTQTPYLTPAQIAAISNPGEFAAISSAARAALTLTQTQALDVAKVWIDKLTPQQVIWLSVPQLQALRSADLKYLTAFQIPYLTQAQIAAIPDPGPFAEWSASARAALTLPQIQVLNVANVWIDKLTPQQVIWLSVPQLQALRSADLKYLNAFQVPYLTQAQIAAIPDPGPFAAWTPEARAALTLPQIQVLNVAKVWIDKLTPQQVIWLSVPQLQALRLADLKYLNAFQIPYLKTSQIAAIPDPGPFSEWSPSARAALTLPQIQVLNVEKVWINQLTPQQVAWLTIPQIQALRLADLKYLGASQTPYLTTAQIAAIPDPGPFSEWSAPARAALTQSQILSLNIAKVWIDKLTPQQISWLTVNQIRQVRWEHFDRLSPKQIPYLTAAQFATITNGFTLRTMPDELEAKFTRDQILGLSPTVYADYTTGIVPPSNYIPTVDIPVGPDGMAIDHTLHAEADRIFDLVPLAAATHVTVATGNWSDPNVWQGGRVPTAGAKVVVSAGTAVRYDVNMTAASAIKTLRIDGALTFATNVNTQLYADTIVVFTTGKLFIGTANAPIADNVTARVTITGGGPIDTVWDPYLLSRGLLSGGEVKMYGKSVTPFTALSVAPVRGATQLTLAQVPTNWKVGDRIALTGTQQHIWDGNESETLIIRAINGNVVTVDPLTYSHVPPAGFGVSVYATNFTRNIVFSAADEGAPPVQRPHMMFFHNPNVDVENIGVFGFGRTDKTIPINDSVVVNGVLQPGTGLNPRARYAMHFHHTGVNPSIAPAVVRGSVIADSAGWGYVNHSSNVLMENNVSYNVVGAGFVSEDGNEIGTMRGNLAMNSTGSGETIESRTPLHDFGHGGHGFWLQGPGVAVVNNVAAGHAAAAYVFFTASSKTRFDAVNMTDPSLAAGRKSVPVGAAPLKQFSGNTALTSNTGLELWFHETTMNDGETYIDNFVAWNMRAGGIKLFYTGQTTIRNSTLVGDMYQFREDGVFTNHFTHDITFENDRIEGFERGIVAPSRRTNVISNTTLNNIWGIYIQGANDTLRTLDISGAMNYKTATALQLKGQQQYQVYASGEVDFTFRTLAQVFSADRIRFNQGRFTLAVVYFPEQAPDYVPFTANNALGIVPDEYLNLTNRQLRERYGVSLGGGYPSYDAVMPAGIRALLDYTPGR